MLGVEIETEAEAVFPPSSSARIPAKQDRKEQDENDIEILSKWNNDGNDDGNNCNDNEVIYRRNVWDSSWEFLHTDERERRNNNGVDVF